MWSAFFQARALRCLGVGLFVFTCLVGFSVSGNAAQPTVSQSVAGMLTGKGGSSATGQEAAPSKRFFSKKNHNDFIAYGLLSTRDLERASARMSPSGAQHVLEFVENVHKERLEAWMSAVPVRQTIKEALAKGTQDQETKKAYSAALDKLRGIKAQEEEQVKMFSAMLSDLSDADRKVLSDFIYVPKMKGRRLSTSAKT